MPRKLKLHHPLPNWQQKVDHDVVEEWQPSEPGPVKYAPVAWGSAQILLMSYPKIAHQLGWQ